MLGDDPLPVGLDEGREGPAKIAARLIQLVDEKAMRHVPLVEEFDQLSRLADARRDRVDDHDRGVGSDERELGFLEEVDEAGTIDQTEVDVRGRSVREADTGRLSAVDALRFVVRRRRAVGDRAPPRDRAGAGEERFDQRRLARMVRADDGNVATAGDISHERPPKIDQ